MELCSTLIYVVAVVAFCQAAPSNSCTEQGEFIRDTDDCSVYYVCTGAGATPVEIECPSGMVFSMAHTNCASKDSPEDDCNTGSNGGSGTNTGSNGGSETTNINECQSTPCQNGGTCVDGINGYSCNCASGFTGENCGTDINECQSTPCQNGGTCVDGINGYSCNCASGFTGDNCGTNINECQSTPCQNSGTCIDGVNGYSCNCASGYTGDNCGTGAIECEYAKAVDAKLAAIQDVLAECLSRSQDLTKYYKAVSQSSENALYRPAVLAVDDVNTTISVTAIEASPWWTMEFWDYVTIAKLEIWNRLDCCGEQLSDIDITVDGVLCGQITSAVGLGDSTVITCSQPLVGKLLKLQRMVPGPLNLAEVQIFAY